MTIARNIASFAREVTLQDVPKPVCAAAVLHLIDAIGVGLASSARHEQQAWSRAIQEGGGPASCLTGGHTSVAKAAMLNGALIHALEFDDTHIASVIHGSAVAAPVALAAAEKANSTGADFLLGYIIAWEIMIRIGLAAPGDFQKRGFQVTSIAGAIGAAATAGRLLGLTHDGIENAMGIAGSQASGLLAFTNNGASVKALNPGWAAHTGLLATDLAASGMTGPESILEGQLGVMQLFAGAEGELAKHVSSLGSNWHLADAAFKLFPCCHYIHPFLEATEEMMTQGLRAEQIKYLIAEVASGQAPLICEPWSRRQAPVSGYDGKWGLAYCIALMLETGKVDVSSFDVAPDEAVVKLARRFHWAPMTDANFPRFFPARLEAETVDGRTLTASVSNVLGTPERPVDPSLIEAKFRDNACRRMGADVCETLLALLQGIADAPNLADLSLVLQLPGAKNGEGMGDTVENKVSQIGSFS